MARNWREIEARMSPEQLARIKARAREGTEQMVLSELRRRAGWSPAAIAAELGIDAATYVELQGADDMPLGTLQQLVRSLGGELDVVVRLPDRTVSLSQLDECATCSRPSVSVVAEPSTAGVD